MARCVCCMYRGEKRKWVNLMIYLIINIYPLVIFSTIPAIYFFPPLINYRDLPGKIVARPDDVAVVTLLVQWIQ